MITDAKRWSRLKQAISAPRKRLGVAEGSGMRLAQEQANRFSSMKRIPFYAVLFSFALLAVTRAADAPSPQDQQLLAMIKEVQAQQAAIAENEARIEAKLASISESLRAARIYSIRGGGK